MIALVGVFTVCFYLRNRQQASGQRVIQNKVCTDWHICVSIDIDIDIDIVYSYSSRAGCRHTELTDSRIGGIPIYILIDSLLSGMGMGMGRGLFSFNLMRNRKYTNGKCNMNKTNIGYSSSSRYTWNWN